MNESAGLVHVWEVEPAEEPAAGRRLGEMLREVAKDPRFISARALETASQASIAAIVKMRRAKDRQRLEQLPEVREVLDHLHGTANVVIGLYHELGYSSA